MQYIVKCIAVISRTHLESEQSKQAVILKVIEETIQTHGKNSQKDDTHAQQIYTRTHMTTRHTRSRSFIDGVAGTDFVFQIFFYHIQKIIQ